MTRGDEIAMGLYAEAGCSLDDPQGPVALAHGLGIKVIASLRVRHARWDAARRAILVSSRLSGPALAWAVAHELGEIALARLGYVEADRERLADAIAAAVVAPRPAFRAAMMAIGSSPRELPALARALVVTQSIAALRLGEVTGRPVALVTPRRVHVRGDEFAWPCENAVRRVAEGRDSAPVERWPLSDAHRRTLLLAS